MPPLIMHNVDNDVVAALKTSAKRDQRSLAEAIRMLRDAVHRGSRTCLRDLADQIAALTPKVPQTDSTALVREGRAMTLTA